VKNWKNILIPPNTSILNTIAVIDKEGLRTALVVDDQRHLLGMVTDGDIRRALLKNIHLDEPIHKIMNAEPITASQSDNREQILLKLQTNQIQQIALLDATQRIVDFVTLENLLALVHKSNPVIVMAGGMGKRLYPLTEHCPKPLLKIGNKPVLEIVLENFVKSGFKNFFFAVNYKSEMIKAYFNQGEQWGVNIRYIEETQRLGTAGALSLLETIPDQAFFVINADVVTNVDFQCLLDFHQESKVDATMCIREHEQTIPFGVVQRDNETHHLLNIIEKPSRQFYVNAGIYILNPHLLQILTPNTFCDMPDLLTLCVKQGYKIATFPIREYWLDIGRHEDLEKAHLEYEKVF
jgi:dTDP-glucose pyrophosphorylase